MPRSLRKNSRNGVPTLDWTGNDCLKTWELLSLLEQPENRKVLVGTEIGENTTGERRITACKRIGETLFPEYASENSSVVADRVKSKLMHLVAAYNKHVRTLQATGSGILEGSEAGSTGDDKQSESFIGPNGPHENTPAGQQNLWKEIIKKFPFFPRLHRLYCTRPNSTPPAITTGVGPTGRSILYLQPRASKGVEKSSKDSESESDEDLNDFLDPALRNSHTNIPTAPTQLSSSLSYRNSSVTVSSQCLDSRNLDLIADVATTTAPPSSSQSFSLLDSNSLLDSPSTFPLTQNSVSPSFDDSFSSSSQTSSISSSTSLTASAGPASVIRVSQSQPEVRSRISMAMANASRRILPAHVQSKKQSVEDRFTEYTNKTLDLISARMHTEEAQAKARLEQQKLELRESRYQSLLRQQEIYERSQQTALRELESGLLSQDEYRDRVRSIRKRADRVADALIDFESSNPFADIE